MHTNQLRLHRLDSDAEPAALVATWLIGELLNVDGISVTLPREDTVILQLAPSTEPDPIRKRTKSLLGESRFGGWTLLDP